MRIGFFTYGVNRRWGVRVDGTDLREPLVEAVRPVGPYVFERAAYERALARPLRLREDPFA
ncbi:hypothetical protein [Streptomyces sp. NPDC089915]|uniref:hypothetical protein n=1 Tax=Streptomyces sp. NPDC089915 TaxID=3155186 RepID=UPI003442700B